MKRPRILIFDVNETLLDLAPLKTSVGKALGGREDLLPLWFSTMLHYSLVETLSGEYHSFGEIGTAALMMVAETQDIELDYEEAKEAIVTPLRLLPPHSDVVAGLQALQDAGFRIVSLTNSSAVGVESQFKNAGLTDLFEKRYSVESVKKFKPHPDTYRFVLDDLGVEPNEVLMVAAHAWDLAGAKHVGDCAPAIPISKYCQSSPILRNRSSCRSLQIPIRTLLSISLDRRSETLSRRRRSRYWVPCRNCWGRKEDC
jgi:2-haloacid dehalogenase